MATSQLRARPPRTKPENSDSQTTQEHRCPECSGRLRTDESRGETSCRDCGLVVEDSRIDHGPDWGRDDTGIGMNEHKRAQVPDRDRHDRGLGSQIGFKSQDPTGRLKRQIEWNDHAKTPRKRDRGRGYATGEIQRIGTALELPDSLLKQAKRLFRRIQDGDHTDGQGCQGFDLDTIAATCVYTVCRDHQRGLTAGDIETVSRAPAKRINRRHKWVVAELGLEIKPPDVRQRLRVVAANAGISDRHVRTALSVLDALDDTLVHKGSPSTVVAGVLYYVAEGCVTQAEVADAAGVSSPALRNRLREIENAD